MLDLDASMFRAYDIRGVFGKTLTEEVVFLIGKGFGSFAREKGVKEIAIARDGRKSGPILAKALANGLLASGCNVVDLGMAPTPVLYYATHILNDHSGIMLTGSHNPPDYNGIKMVLNGSMFAAERIQALYERIITNRFCEVEEQGQYRQFNFVENYIDQMSQTIKLKRPLKIVIDAGNGVTGMMAPQLFGSLGCQVHALFCEVDGQFPNHHPDPSDPKNMQDLIATVRDTHADIGLAFDGDGDRLGVVTSNGEIIYK